MRIAVVHNLPSGGAKRHTLEQVLGLERRGHDLVEFAPNSADLGFCSLAPHVSAQRVFAAGPPLKQARRIPFLTPYVNMFRGLQLLRRTEAVNRAMAQAVDSGGFDLAFVKDCHIVMNPYVLSHLHTPSIFQCHHGLRHHSEAHAASDADGGTSLVARLKATYYAPARAAFSAKLDADAQRNIRSASKVLTNSNFSRVLLRAQYGLEVHVIYPGINTSVFQPTGEAKHDYVMCAGALIYSKGYRFLVAAVEQLPASSRPMLMIAANFVDPVEERVVRAMAHRAGVSIEIETVTDDARLRELYAGARAFVYAPIQEPLGMAPLEAMACGTPVVAVAEGGVEETVRHGETGFLVERDPVAFAERLNALLVDAPLSHDMALAGIQYVKHTWTWDRAIDRLESEFRAVASA
jgi:glycosyltransferase involved in cell wall biosynthesis